MTSVPCAGTQAPLNPFESVLWGGGEEDVTGCLHPDNSALALRVAALFGLSIAGIDIVNTDIAMPWHENNAIVNEVNFAPTLGDGPVSTAGISAFLTDFITGTAGSPLRFSWAASWQWMPQKRDTRGVPTKGRGVL